MQLDLGHPLRPRAICLGGRSESRRQFLPKSLRPATKNFPWVSEDYSVYNVNLDAGEVIANLHPHLHRPSPPLPSPMWATLFVPKTLQNAYRQAPFGFPRCLLLQKKKKSNSLIKFYCYYTSFLQICLSYRTPVLSATGLYATETKVMTQTGNGSYLSQPFLVTCGKVKSCICIN